MWSEGVSWPATRVMLSWEEPIFLLTTILQQLLYLGGRRFKRQEAEGEISGQNGWGKPKTSPQIERHGGETSSQSLPQKYVRTHWGGQEPDSKTEPVSWKLGLWISDVFS